MAACRAIRKSTLAPHELQNDEREEPTSAQRTGEGREVGFASSWLALSLYVSSAVESTTASTARNRLQDCSVASTRLYSISASPKTAARVAA
jgi:hypothetical protein